MASRIPGDAVGDGLNRADSLCHSIGRARAERLCHSIGRADRTRFGIAGAECHDGARAVALIERLRWIAAGCGNVDGLSGWRVAYVANASSVAGVCTGVSGALGSEMAVYATCSASKTLHVELSDADPSLAAGGPLATFDVDCAASPVLVYRSAGDPKLVGHFVQIFLVDPPEGDYQFLVQTTDGPLPSPAPALTP